MEPVDLEHHEIEIVERARQPGLQLASRQRHETARDRRLRGCVTRCRRQIAARIVRQAHRAGILAGRDVDHHQIHRPGLQEFGFRQQLPTRQAHLPTREVPHPRALDLHFAAVVGDLAPGRAPSMALALARAGVARTAQGFRVRRHHLVQRLEARQKAEAIDAHAQIVEGLRHRWQEPTGWFRGTVVACSLGHGVVLLDGISTQSLAAPGGRRLLQLFNRARDIPSAPESVPMPLSDLIRMTGHFKVVTRPFRLFPQEIRPHRDPRTDRS